MRRVVYVVSNIDRSLSFEWVADLIDKDRFAVSFVLLNRGDSELERFCRRAGVPVKRIRYRGKWDLPKVFLQVLFHLIAVRADVVHCHMFDASLLGLPAALLAGVRSRIYTRHNATYHRRYYPHMVKFDLLANRISSCVVATNKNVSRVLIRDEGLPERKLRVIRHGFDLSRFARVPQSEVDELAKRYDVVDCYPVVGVIARYLDLKGIQYIIPAWKRLRKEFPDAHLILANARGPFAGEIERQLAGVSASAFTEVPFEHNIFALYKLFDIYVHVPVDPEIEAFGQTYVEALASGVPSVFTMSGIAPEFIRDEHNALVVPFEESAPVFEAMKRLLTEPELRERITRRGEVDVEQFGIDGMIRALEGLYSE